MDHKYLGSCLCQKIQFVVDGPFDHFYLCHCSYCRKDTGSAHAANLFSTTATLIWISGEDRVQTFNLSPTRHSKSFCSHCGSAVPNYQMNGKLLVVPAGSLDSDIPLKPEAHLFISSKASWDNQLEVIKKFDQYPS